MKNKLRKCPYCNIDVNCYSPHIKLCAKLHNDNNSKYTYIITNFPKTKNKEDIIKKYTIEKYSLPMLRDYLDGLDLKSIQWLLNFYGITLRSISEALKDPIVRERCNKANIEKFGAINTFSKDAPGYRKRNKTVKYRYGVDNVFQVINEFDCKKSHRSKISSLNIRIQNILDKYFIPYTEEFKLEEKINGKTITRYFDFMIWYTNKLIEINGNYWHANPRIYNENTIFNFPKQTLTYDEIHDNDMYKEKLALANGYKVKYIWEDEMKKMSDDQLYNYIMYKINEE